MQLLNVRHRAEALLLSLSLLAGLGLLGPRLVSAALANRAMVGYHQALERQAAPAGFLDAGPALFFDTLAGDPGTQAVLGDAQAAVALDASAYARTVLGRVAAALGRYDLSHAALAGLDRTSPDPQVRAYGLVAAGRAGDPEAVLALAQPGALLPATAWISDTLALAEIGRALTASDMVVAAQHLRQALAARPDDLHAAFRLWQAGSPANAPAALRDRLRAFTPAGIAPLQPDLFEIEVPVLADLVAAGIWDRGTFLAVLGSLAWQHPTSPALAQAIAADAQAHPADPQIRAVQADLDARRGPAPAPDVSPAPAPPDPLPTRLPASPASANPQVVAVPAMGQPDAAVAAALLGAAGSLGPNLLPNGAFAAGLADWRWLDQTGDPFNPAAFLAGIDPYPPARPGRAARIDGLWLAASADKAPARFGLRAYDDDQAAYARFAVVPGSCVLVRVPYRTAGPAERVTVYLGPKLPVMILPPAAGTWREMVLLYCPTPAQPAQVELLLRLHSPGSAWFSGLTLRRLAR